MPALYPTTIYGLVDPRTDELRYVGKTTQTLAARLRMHLNDAQKIRRRHCCTWIRSLMRDGVTPEIFDIETVKGDWVQAEQFWIAYFRFVGARLTNETIGGEGVPGRRQTEETRLKMSRKGKVTQGTPEMRALKSERMKRKHADPEFKARHKTLLKEAANRPEVKAKLAAYRADPEYMKWHASRVKATFDAEPERLKRRGEAISKGLNTPEVRAKKSESLRKYHATHPMTDEMRAILLKANKGRVVSEETRARMSAAAKRRKR